MKLSQLKYFNFIYFSNTINIGYIEERGIVTALVKAYGKAFYFSFSAFISFLKRGHLLSSSNKVVFFTISDNNYLSIQPVYEKFSPGEAIIFSDRKFNRHLPIFTPTIIAAWLSVFFLPKLLVDYFRLNATEKSGFKKGANDVILSYPFYYATRIWLKVKKPRAVVIVNDHVFSTRTLTYWADRIGVPSFYIQHASVTEGFPPLDMKYALLEGEDARNKYLKVGSSPEKIELIGIPKLDRFFYRINNGTTIANLGIASNGLEPLSTIFEIISQIQKHYPELSIVYRPHRSEYYGERRKLLLEFFTKLKTLDSTVQVSDPHTENVMDYLSRIDCMIAGDSGIHLEAVWLNVTSIYFYAGGEHFDYYGFLKNDLVLFSKEIGHLIAMLGPLINNRVAFRGRAKKYCATIDTEFDGHSSELTVRLIRERSEQQKNNLLK